MECGAQTTIQFALASGIDGDYEKAFSEVPKKPDGKKVALKPFAARARKLAVMLSSLVNSLLAARKKPTASKAVSGKSSAVL